MRSLSVIFSVFCLLSTHPRVDNHFHGFQSVILVCLFAKICRHFPYLLLQRQHNTLSNTRQHNIQLMHVAFSALRIHIGNHSSSVYRLWDISSSLYICSIVNSIDQYGQVNYRNFSRGAENIGYGQHEDFGIAKG